MKIGISLKVSILTGIVAFAVAMFIGNYSNNISSKQLEAKAGESLVNLSKHIAEILDREMLERYRELQFAATMPALTNESNAVKNKRAFLEQIKSNTNHHEWIGFALPDGTVEAGTSGYLEGKNAKARPWLPAGLKGPYIGDVHDALLLAKLLPNNTGEAIYFTDVAFPVKNDNKVLGVLCTHLSWQWTRDIIRSIEKKNNIEIFLLAKDGMVLVGPDESERKQLSDISKAVANEFNNEKSYFKLLDWKLGEEYLTAHTISEGFEEYKGFGWKVIVRQPKDIAFVDATTNSNSIFMMSLLVAVIGALVGIILTNIFISPLRRLTEQVILFTKTGSMNLEKSEQKDEIGVLQNALIELNENLQKESEMKKDAEDKVRIALQIFDQAVEGLLVTDNQNNIILINKAFSKITGYSQEDVYMKNPSILSSGEYNKEFYEDMWNDIIKKGKWEGQLNNKRKDGGSYTESLKVSTLKDENGNIINFIGTFLGEVK